MPDAPVPIVEGLRETPLHEERDFQGLSLVIEYHKGDRKPDKSSSLPGDWGYVQYADYGYIDNTVSNEEGEGIDVFVGDHDDDDCAYLLPLMEPKDHDAFMEYKVLLGMGSRKAAHEFACQQYPVGMHGHMIEISVADLCDWADVEGPMADKLDALADDQGAEGKPAAGFEKREDVAEDNDEKDEGEILTLPTNEEYERPDIMELVAIPGQG